MMWAAAAGDTSTSRRAPLLLLQRARFTTVTARGTVREVRTSTSGSSPMLPAAAASGPPTIPSLRSRSPSTRHWHTLRRHWPAPIDHGSRWFASSPPSSSTSPPSRPLPIGIFVDLDNVAPRTQGRDDVRAFVSPLKQFARKATGSDEIDTFQAFANEATQTWVTGEERERREEHEQEYIAWGLWDADELMAQTGYDEDGMLRCGVCGAKMKLSKKDRRAGMTLERKLDKHMRMLHDREQEKRRTRMKERRGKKGKGKKKKALSDKEMEKFRKYEAAQVGLWRTPARRIKPPKGGPRPKKRNDLFRILGEFRVKRHSVGNVDESLEKGAVQWMQTLVNRDLHFNDDVDAIGCLVVVSEDADFCDLLDAARKKGIVAVSVAGDSKAQTRGLAASADLVLEEGVPRAITGLGLQLLMEMNSRQTYDEDDNDDDVVSLHEEDDVELGFLESDDEIDEDDMYPFLLESDNDDDDDDDQLPSLESDNPSPR